MLWGCVENAEYPNYACQEFCDELGCRDICNNYYYNSSGVRFYFDPALGIWIGGGGYYKGGIFYQGYYRNYHPEYRGYYHERGFAGGRVYSRTRYYGGASRFGGGRHR